MTYAGGLFGCMQDTGSCIFGAFCLPCLNGQNHAKIRDEECTICHVWNFHAPYWIRKELEKRNSEDATNDCNDCLMTTFCAPCAVCQDARALADS